MWILFFDDYKDVYIVKYIVKCIVKCVVKCENLWKINYKHVKYFL